MSTIIEYIPNWSTWGMAGIALLIPILGHLLYQKVYHFIGTGTHLHGDVPANQSEPSSPAGNIFSGDYDQDLSYIQDKLGANSDMCFREFTLNQLGVRGTLLYVDGMQNDRLLQLKIMTFLMYEATAEKLASPSTDETGLPFLQLQEATNLDGFNHAVLFGHIGLLIEGMPIGLLVEQPDARSRPILEPLSEALLRGPRVGFTEILSENTSMLRRQGMSDQLEIKSYRVGTRMQRDLVLAYMKDVVNPDLLKEVQTRITRMEMDFFAESGYVEQLIEDNYLSPFQQVQNTERPDRVINAIMEGRVAILLDGTPFALIVPATFSMLLQSPEDYYERWLPSSLLRIMRFGAAFLALMAPALYISFISFHPGLIPTELAISIIETRQGVPFPSLIEVLILEVAIEILREAGIRLPKPIGPAMGIVGGLIIGDAAVQAGIVSPFLVIVVAVTAISSFSIPTYSAGITLRMLRFIGMVFAAVLGIFGTILFFLLLCSHLSKLKSFGVPYLTPISPFRLRDWKDLFFRAPLSLMKRRPAMMKTQQDKRKS